MVEDRERLLVPGQTCWRIERADRFALIIDAANYFRAVKAAMLNAKHSVMLIGWDLDTRAKFEPEGKTLEGPNALGHFLSWLPKHRPGLKIYVLKWDLGVVQGLGRGMTPIFILDWITSREVRFKLDGAHPAGAAHHQKIVAIDDAVAFCGGIDMLTNRWDTREHLDNDPRRTLPDGDPYGPWHDAMTAVDGKAARALGDLARDRWREATGERLDPPQPEDANLWPEDLTPTIEAIDVAIARTIPKMEHRGAVREVEALHLKGIAQAKHTIYFESQYFASRTIAEALAERLGQPDGPEIVIVLPQTTEGWLECEVMDGARAKLLNLLWNADKHDHVRVFYPVTHNKESIYVHAKIMVVDDRLLRVGSSNLNNRSMGFDTECDLAIEAVSGSPDEQRLSECIRSVRRGLLCEHLGIELDALDAAMERSSGSLLAAVEALRSDGRTLEAFQPSDIEGERSALAENDLLDPEDPAQNLKKRIPESLLDIISNLTIRRS